MWNICFRHFSETVNDPCLAISLHVALNLLSALKRDVKNHHCLISSTRWMLMMLILFYQSVLTGVIFIYSLKLPMPQIKHQRKMKQKACTRLLCYSQLMTSLPLSKTCVYVVAVLARVQRDSWSCAHSVASLTTHTVLMSRYYIRENDWCIS